MNKQRRIYRALDGVAPFEVWLGDLKDVVGRAKIHVRMDRASQGNFGDHRSVGAGVIELRIHYGPGYRVYIGLHGRDIIVMLLGGDKSDQVQDISRAHEYWDDYKRRL